MNEIQNDDLLENEASGVSEDSELNQGVKCDQHRIANLEVFCFKTNSTCDDLLTQHLKLQVIEII